MKQPKIMLLVLWTVLALTLLSVTGAFVWSVVKEKADRSSLPLLGTLPDFEFPTHLGEPISARQLRGSVWVAMFFFTSCASICPIMNRNMTKVQAAFDDQPEVKILAFTVDPQHDTVPILRAYSENWGAKPHKWYYVTGSKKALYRLAREGFKLAVEEAPPVEPGGPNDFIHSDRFVLVDRLGRIRGYYNGTDEAEVQKLITDLRRLLKE